MDDDAGRGRPQNKINKIRRGVLKKIDNNKDNINKKNIHDTIKNKGEKTTQTN